MAGAQGILQDALERGDYWRLKDAAGKLPGVVGWWPSRAVTFLDNHDTGNAHTVEFLFLLLLLSKQGYALCLLFTVARLPAAVSTTDADLYLAGGQGFQLGTRV